MGAGKAVQLNETTTLVPVFDPQLRYFVAQLWQNGDVTAVLGEFGTCRHPDDVLDAVDAFLAEHGLAPLTESQVPELAFELIMAKGGPDAEMLLIAIEQAKRALANERRAAALPCTVSWASSAAYSTAAVHDRHTADGSPLVEVLVAALPDANGEHRWNASDITLIYANGSVGTLSIPGSTFDEELSDIADRTAVPIDEDMDLSIKTDKAALTDYQTTDVAAVAVRLLAPGWTDQSDPEAATMLRHADGTVVTLTEASTTSTGPELQLDASIEDRADVHESGRVDNGHLSDLLSAAEHTAQSISAVHRAVHASRGAADGTPLRTGLRYQAHAEPGGWIVKDSMSGFEAAKLPDDEAADRAAAALSLAALAGPASSLVWEQRRPDGSPWDAAEQSTAELTALLTYHRDPEGAGTTYEWAPDRIVIRYPDGDVTTIRPVTS